MRKEEGEMTASLSRRPDSPAATPPLEDEDLLGEILLRLSPLPSSLPRASLVSDRWRLLVSDPKFLRRFSLRHRHNPPLLGFFDRGFVPTLDAPDRVPPGRFSLPFDDHDHFWIANSRHGLLLVFLQHLKKVVVWDPITAVQHHISLPPPFAGFVAGFVAVGEIHGAVLRAAGEAHHFQVVLIRADDDTQDTRVLACVYSSETGVWGDVISAPLPPRVHTSDLPILVYVARPSVLVENSLYWMLGRDFVGILEFDLERKCIALIQPPVDMFTKERFEFSVVRAQSGGLGFLFFSKSDCNIQIWKRKTDCDGVASWVMERTIELVMERTIELNKLIPMNPEYLHVVGYAEENNVVVLWIARNMFMLHLDSLQFKKLPYPALMGSYHPFESVYATETCIGGGHNGAERLLSMPTC